MNSQLARFIIFALFSLMNSLSEATPLYAMDIYPEFLFPKNSPSISPDNQEIELLECEIGRIDSLQLVGISANFSELAGKKSQELLRQRVDHIKSRLLSLGIPQKKIEIYQIGSRNHSEQDKVIEVIAFGKRRNASVKCTPYLSTLYSLLSVEQSLLVVRTDLKEERYSLLFPLRLAISDERPTLFDALFTQSKLVNFSAKARQELMNAAIDNNQPDVIESLIAHGMALKDLEHPALPIVRAVCDESPYKKTEAELIRVVKKLLDWGATVEYIHLGGFAYDPLTCARQRSQNQVADLLQAKGFLPDSPQTTPFRKGNKYAYIKTRDEKAIRACADSGGTWDETSRRPQGYCVGDTKEKCTARKGFWGRVCMSQSLACIMTYPDAGKDCTDGSQCQGRRCLAKEKESPDANGVLHGACRATTDPCGSFPEITNGKRGALMNVD